MEHITPAFRSNRLLQGLVCWLIVLWIITAIEPFNRRDWFLENLLVFFYGTLLMLTYRRFTFSGLSYLLFRQTLNAGGSLEYAQTMAFATLIFAQLWHIFDSRSSSTVFRKNPFGNRMLLGAVAGSAALSLMAIYTTPGQFVLGTESLSARHLVAVIAISSLPTLGLSALKEIFRFKFL